MLVHRFYRENGGWYIDLPEYLEQGGSKDDLALISGADTMLDVIAGKDHSVTIGMDTRPFEGSDELILTELCDPILGGGYYHMKQFEKREVLQDMWLCEVTRFVFNDIPPKIFVKRLMSL